MSRLFLAAGALVLSGLPAVAGGFGCVGDCYTPTYVPPTYGLVAEKVVMRAPQSYAIVSPARYKTVYDTVQVGGGRVWSVTRDPVTGRLVGCWITKPATYATVARTVLVSPQQVVPYAASAVYGYRTQSVMTSPGYKAWAPVASPSAGGYAYGGGYGGYGARASYGAYGYGFGPRPHRHHGHVGHHHRHGHAMAPHRHRGHGHHHAGLPGSLD